MPNREDVFLPKDVGKERLTKWPLLPGSLRRMLWAVRSAQHFSYEKRWHIYLDVK